MKKSLLVLFTSALVLGCAEDDFVSNRQETDEFISFATRVDEMSDINRTRGGGRHNAAHHHDMTGAKTPMFVRFTQTESIDKYLKCKETGRQDDTSAAQVTPPLGEGYGGATIGRDGGRGWAPSRGRRIDSIPDFYDDFGLII